MRRIHVVHPITKMAVGGAQESVLVTAGGLPDPPFAQVIVTGPEVDEEGDLFGVAAGLGIDVEVCPEMRRAVHPVADARSVLWLVRWLRRQRPDIVHTHSSKAGLLGRLSARLARVPVVVHSVHGWSFHDEMPGALRWAVVTAERLAARGTTRLVIEGRPDRDKGLRAGIGRPDQYVLIRNGIDLAAFQPDREAGRAVRAELGLPVDAVVVGTVGRLADQKDPLAMVEAVGHLAAVDGLHFVWIGDGPLRSAVEAAISDRGLVGRFHLVGVRRDVARVLNALDVFVLSSLWEGLPRTVTEAMAVGVPVVATAVDGVAEVIDDGVTGLLVPPHDPSALAGRIEALLGDADLMGRLRSAGFERAREFDRVEMLRRLAALYDELVGAVRRPVP